MSKFQRSIHEISFWNNCEDSYFFSFYEIAIKYTFAINASSKIALDQITFGQISLKTVTVKVYDWDPAASPFIHVIFCSFPLIRIFQEEKIDWRLRIEIAWKISINLDSKSMHLFCKDRQQYRVQTKTNYMMQVETFQI